MLAPTSQGKSDSRTEASATITIVDQPASEIGGWGSNKVHRSAISINATENRSQNSGILYGGLQHFKQQLLYDQDFPDPDLRTESQGKGALSKSCWTVRGYIPHILQPVQTESQGAISK